MGRLSARPARRTIAHRRGFCQNALARCSGDVVRVLADHVALHLETCIVMHEDLRDVRRYRVVFDALVEGLSRHVDVT